MNAIQQVSTPETELKQGSQSISFAEFLESVPPLQVKEIDVLAAKKPNRYGTSLVMLTPEIRLYCGHDGCNGMRFFRAIGGPDIAKRGTFDNCYLTYMCSNCHQTAKTFSVAARLTGGDIGDEMSGQCYKFGESPAFAPVTPSRLMTLIGPDRDLFLQGRQCENHGLGLGAFVYYKRVLENQKGRILGDIITAAERMSVPTGMVAALKAAQQETRFEKALESVSDAVPVSLLINGHNPLALLHAAMSGGSNDKTDGECLELAHDIRVVLAELADRLDQALRDEAELNAAVARLGKRRESR